ncbi:hypothetical protein DSC45_34650 [Streptomyces sp. YIM 130001]|uniref:peptidoglycan-binding protein n=1 Tax=Streptomyces sp. YIM 130001 TaxID=2259644 RepID=UPI000E653806|nr:peptidoglycan-binding protein [Streptomyces sp. YIM 130001]RII06970.1 hypothetical protein DSC45_34650 [Streptomyces sp. YIM 130001]
MFCDLRTDQVRDAFPISGATIEDYLGKSGTCTGTLNTPDTATAQCITEAVIPGRTAVWIERDRQTWWGGIVWTLTANSTSREGATAEQQAATFDSYCEHRLLTEDLRATDVDQFEVARRLVTFAQSADGADIGIRLDEAALKDPRAPRGHTTHKDEVLRVEHALLAEGLLAGKWADGAFGTKTIAAYARWQRDLGFKGSAADGIPGCTSLQVLGDQHDFYVTD